jgi:hypothetical protein
MVATRSKYLLQTLQINHSLSYFLGIVFCFGWALLCIILGKKKHFFFSESYLCFKYVSFEMFTSSLLSCLEGKSVQKIVTLLCTLSLSTS